MNRFFALVRVSFLQLLYGFKGSSRRKGKGPSGAGALALLAGISLYMSIAYSMMFFEMLGQIGREDLLIFLMSTVAVVMSLMLTAFSAGGLLFGGKDTDLVLSLPVSAFEVMLSKTLALYLENAVIMLFLMLPAGVIYMVKSASFSVLMLLALALCTLLLALCSTLAAFIVGYLITWITSRIKGSKLLSNLLYFVFFGLVMAFAFSVNSLGQRFAASASGYADTPGGAAWLFAVYSKAVFGDLASFALLLAASVIPFVIVVWIFSTRYKAVVNAIAGVKTRSDFKLREVKSTSQFSALLRKEAGRYFGNPLYLFNTGFGLVMLIAAAVFAAFERPTIAGMLAEMQFESIPGGITPLLAGCVCFLVATSCCASISISLERDRLWILKESPVATMDIFHAKALFNIIINVGTALIACPLLGWALGVSAPETAAVVLLCAVFSVFMAYSGLLINLRYPKLDALNDTVIIKQSLAAMLPILLGMALVGGVTALYISALASRLSFWTFALICTALLAGLSALCLRLLAGWGSRRFAEL